MHRRNYITNELENIVLRQIEKAADEFGIISYSIKNIYIYGSTLSDKKNPNDIDVYVELDYLSVEYPESFDLEYEDEKELQEFVAEKMHDYVHGCGTPFNNQPYLNNKKIDINIQTVSFEDNSYTGNKIKISDYLSLPLEKKLVSKTKNKI